MTRSFGTASRSRLATPAVPRAMLRMLGTSPSHPRCVMKISRCVSRAVCASTIARRIAYWATRPTRRAAASSSFAAWLPKPPRPARRRAITWRRASSAVRARRRVHRWCRSAGSWKARARCCALHAHAGEGQRARELARYNVDAFAGSDAKIVVNAAGCGAHLKAYGELLADDPAWAERAKAFAARVRDVSEVAHVVPSRITRQLRVVYQDACHLAHGQRIRTQPRALLQAIEGVTLVEIADPERCCGSAGVYNLMHPEISRTLQRSKVEAILDVRPDVVVSANPGCMLQIAAGLRDAGSNVRVVHLARFLDDPEAALR